MKICQYIQMWVCILSCIPKKWVSPSSSIHRVDICENILTDFSLQQLLYELHLYMNRVDIFGDFIMSNIVLMFFCYLQHLAINRRMPPHPPSLNKFVTTILSCVIIRCITTLGCTFTPADVNKRSLVDCASFYVDAENCS